MNIRITLYIYLLMIIISMSLCGSVVNWDAVKHQSVIHSDMQKNIDLGSVRLYFTAVPEVVYDDSTSGIMRFSITIPKMESGKKALLMKKLNEIHTQWYTCRVQESKNGIVLVVTYNPSKVEVVYDGISDERDMSKCMTIRFCNKPFLLELQNKDTVFLEFAMNALLVPVINL